jgi:hypothetical protein
MKLAGGEFATGGPGKLRGKKFEKELIGGGG